ncbi:ABC transporter permease [Paenibacillus solani]|uniref:ABC transporter permease n=1 Tax=Paenibacillus solani TaxID=1705565 RepID=UPI003D2E04D6
MNQWMIMFRKEMLEMWRNSKWIWLPIVFVLFGIMQPVTAYYLPQILENTGSMTEGTIINISMPTGGEVLIKTLSQYGTIGLLIIVLASMGMVSNERISGVAGMILMKPVKFASYLTVKWAAAVTITIISFTIGFFVSWYYTSSLIGEVNLSRAFISFLLYCLWLAFIITITLLASTSLKGNAAAAFITLAFATVLSLMTSVLSKYMHWSPSHLTDQATTYLMKGEFDPHLSLVLTVTSLSIIVLLYLSIYVFKKKELGV